MRFVDACHGKGLAVLLDVVYNHLGPAGNYLGKFGPYFTDAHHTPWGDAVNLEDAGSHEVRRFFCDNALMWLRDYHFDGLRLDAVHAYMDRSAIHFMEQIAAEVHALEGQTGPPFRHHCRERSERSARGAGPRGRRLRHGRAVERRLPSRPGDRAHRRSQRLLRGFRRARPAGQIAARRLRLRRTSTRRIATAFTERRCMGCPAGASWGSRRTTIRLAIARKGERLCHLVSLGRAKIAAALELTAPFVPMIFQGEEWAASSPFQYFTDHEEELGRLVSEGRTKEFAAFGWDPKEIPDPQAGETFERSKLELGRAQPAAACRNAGVVSPADCPAKKPAGSDRRRSLPRAGPLQRAGALAGDGARSRGL